MTSKFETIIDSLINGNIQWVKAAVKKLSKENRKALYTYCTEYAPDQSQFIFNLI